MDECLETINVTLKGNNAELIHLDAIVEDTLPAGSDVGTVIAFHGVPGSHYDYKTLKSHLQERDIRLVIIDFPGFGFTAGDERLNYDGDELVEFAEEIFKQIKPKGKLLFLGHSRGTEVALRMSTLHEEQTSAMVLVNPIGLSAHRSVRPRWLPAFLAWLWTLGFAIRFVLGPLLYLYFTKLLCMRIKNSDVAATTIKTVSKIKFSDQLHYIQQLRTSPIQVLIAYSGSDRLIERSISEHFVNEFEEIKRMNCQSNGPDRSTFDEYVKLLNSGGSRKVAICFSKEGHLLPRNRAEFLADAIEALFKND